MASENQTREIRLPRITDRLVEIGRTGSGKTVAGLWHLSHMPIDRLPFVIIDYKRDEQIAAIPFANHIKLGDRPLVGVNIVQPLIGQRDTLEAYLWAIWQHENTGIFVDEGYMLNDSEAFNTILMQGRSKAIPVIVLTQRPVYLSRYAFSQATFIQVFDILDKRDAKIIGEFTPLSSFPKLEEFSSYYYDVNEDRLNIFPPIDPEETRYNFERKLEPLLEKPQRVYI